jgi:type IV pilus assembly protein PilN
MTTAPLDLLREQRQQQGLPDPALERQTRRSMVLKGALIGAALLAGSGVVTGLLFVRQQWLRAELDRLALVEAQVQAAERRLVAARTTLKIVNDANEALVQGLVNVRSGSALLRDLQRRTPQGVQLTTVEVAPGGSSLRLAGSAADPVAFARINALQIELARSPLLLPTSVTLLKAVRGGDAGTAAPAATLPKLVSFEITAAFRKPLPPAAELLILQELGAQGMVKRLQRLQAEGLLR